MQLFRVVIGWSGPQIKGNAVTVLHYDGTNQTTPPVAGIASALASLAGALPVGVVLSVPGSGDIIDDTTGHLTGVWSSPSGTTVNASGPANCAAGVGACIEWSTGGIVNGKKGPRRLRGRTFLVPLHSSMYDTDGTISGQGLNSLKTFADNLAAAGPLGIWHRPTTVGGTDGSSSAVLSHNVRDKVAILTSRRD